MSTHSKGSVIRPRAMFFHAQSYCFCAVMLALAGTGAHGANGVVYYNSFLTPSSAATVRRVGGDGTGDQPVAVNLPEPSYPTVSRNGRLLMVTSPDPGRPFKMSKNVYIRDLLTGALGRATSYEDEVVLNGVHATNDLGQLQGNQFVSGYKIYFPWHKALSPDGTRIVVMNLFKAGLLTQGSGFNPYDIDLSAGRTPYVDVYNLADALPAGGYVYLSPQERDGHNQGGDGVDWHPALEEIVATVAADVPAVGTAGINSMAGTLIAVYGSSGFSPFIRKLTTPVAQIDIVNGSLFYFGVHDYAPAISPNGQQVAFVRHVRRAGQQSGYAAFPAQCSIHIINYNGSGEHSILPLGDGMWVTKVAWSPDGSQIVLDLAPQLVLNGLYSQLGNVSQSQLHMVNADGSNPHLMFAGPAAYPSWGPELSAPPIRPVLQISRNGSGLQLRVDGLSAGQPFRLDGTTNLQGGWGPLLSTQSTGPGHLINITPDPQARSAFYRVVVP